MPLPPVLELDNVSVAREGCTLLDAVSLVIPPRRHTAVLGPNGAGKTSLLRVLVRDYYPSVDPSGRSGLVRILGRDDWNIAELRRRMGVVSSSLDDDFSHGRSGRLTVVEAVASGFSGSRLADDGPPRSVEEQTRVAAAIELCDATSFRERRLETLSTGERRRTLIARALVHRPELLVLDEPTSGLDPVSRGEFLETLRRLCRQPDMTVFLVTHHLEEIVPEIGHVVLLDRGRVVFDGPSTEAIEPGRLAAVFGARGGSDVAATAGLMATDPTVSLTARLLEALERLEPFLERDPLTGVRNRLCLDARVRRAVESADGSHPLVVALVDIDRFGLVNARHGHRAGDQCLRQLTATLEGYLHETDVVFRYGGDEFLVLMPSTSLEEAVRRLETARAGLAATPIRHAGLAIDRLTVSIGVAAATASTAPADTVAEMLLKAADAAMYCAKERGGDRVHVASMPPAGMPPR